MTIIKAEELRDMSDEQLALTLKETCDSFFKLKIQAQTERLGAPSELMKKRRLIARALTIQNERKRQNEQAAGAKAVAAAK